MAYPRRSPEEIERGLTALIVSGSSLKASKLTGIPDKTIREFKRKNPERYEQLRTELHAKVAEQVASDAEHMAQRLAGIEHKLIDKLEASIPDMDARDLHPALRNVTTSKALQMDKISGPVRERPAYMPHGMDMEGLRQRMLRALGLPNEPVVDAEVVETKELAA